MSYRTLEDLRGELRGRCGYSAVGAAAGVQVPILNSFLRGAQSVLYWTHDWARLREYSDKSVGVNQYLIDYPVNCNPERISAISILDGTLWTPPLKKGIAPEDYTYQANLTRPSRWEPYSQIEFNAKADKAYTARVFYVKKLGRFSQDADTATIDDDLVFLFALADAKAHYRHPDAQVYTQERDALLLRLKAKNWGQSTFSPRGYEPEALAKPVVV